MQHIHADEELFSAALSLPVPERTRYLQRACGDNSPAFRRLRILIDAFSDATSFVGEQSITTESDAEHIGPYRLLRELGEGGCGVAYLAEQESPVKRHVALKIIKPGMDTKAVVARFQAEQQLLALMDHPNVAKVFDAGATPAGRPYFVMELVRGIRITDYCNQSRLTVAERLALFTQVCQAIQHAHQKGIIHRDIKPSNVLVTMHDGLPLAKVIDFGIAKATQGPLTDQTLHTAFDQFLGTPEYVSPEQTEPGPSGVDTRSDIYSLGVLLYELLTGHTPFNTSDLLQAGIEQMRQLIRNEEPARPSKRLSASSDETSQEVSAYSSTTAAKLIHQIEGDLDWIVMRCLEKELARRYQTVNDLIGDVQRYLHHEPVLARPPSLHYLVRKFARRHRVMFVSSLVAAVFVICITGFGIVMSIQAQRIAAERDRAEQENTRAETVSEFMIEVFSNAEPFGYGESGKPESAKELLDRAGRRIQGNLSQQPDVRARLLEAIGRAYRRQGQYDRSISFLEEALLLRTQMPGENGAKTASVLTELAIALRQTGDLDGADRALRRALQLSRANRDEHSIAYATLLTNLGRVEIQVGQAMAAKEHFEQSLALNRELLGPGHPEVASVLIELSNVFLWNDDIQAAERAAREAVNIYHAKVPELHPDRVLADVRLAETLQSQHRLNEAAPLLESSLKAQRQLYGENSRQVADILDSLSMIRRSEGLFAEAEEFARQALRAHELGFGKSHFMTAYFRTSLASLLLRRGKMMNEAERQLRDALKVYDETLPPDHQYVASAKHFLGEVLLATNRLRDAEAVLTAAMNRWSRTDAAAWRSARSASALGEVLYREGRAREAERYLTESYQTLANDDNADREARIKARERVVRFYTDRGQQAKLQALISTTRGDGASASASPQN